MPVPSAVRDVVFLVDSSDAVPRRGFRKSLQFIRDIVGEVGLNNTRFGLVTYSSQVNTPIHLGKFDDKKKLMRAISKVQYTGGDSDIVKGLRTIRREMFSSARGDRVTAPNALILLTGSTSTVSQKWVSPAAKGLRSLGIAIYGVGVGLKDRQQLNNIVTPPANKYRFTVRNYNNLNKIRQPLIEAAFGGM